MLGKSQNNSPNNLFFNNGMFVYIPEGESAKGATKIPRRFSQNGLKSKEPHDRTIVSFSNRRFDFMFYNGNVIKQINFITDIS